jgi:hypothetical protein
MQLRNARLCLDCEDVHDAPQCPTCASETFAFITRWVPAPERRDHARPPQDPPRPAELQAYRTLLDAAQRPNGGGWKLVRQGAMGLALVGVAGWLWKSASADASADKAGGARRAEEEPPSSPNA